MKSRKFFLLYIIYIISPSLEIFKTCLDKVHYNLL